MKTVMREMVLPDECNSTDAHVILARTEKNNEEKLK
jgi:hypothetical protein